MKKLFATLVIMISLLALAACGKKETVKLTQEEVFGGVQTIQVLEGDSFNLQDWFKDSDAFTYTTDDVVDSSKEGGQIIIVKATSKDGQVYTKGQCINIITLETLYTEDVLTLQAGKKLDEIAVKEGYKITYEGDIDYNTPGEYVIRFHVTDPDGKEYTTEKTITIVEEPVQTINNGGSSNGGTTQTNSASYGDDSYIWQLARSYEQNKSGSCDQVARAFLQEYKGIDTMRYEFATTSSPKPGDLVRYTFTDGRPGGHVAVYLGNDMALHGGYNGTGVKIGTIYTGEYPVMTFYSTDNILQDYYGGNTINNGGSNNGGVEEIRNYVIEETKKSDVGQEILAEAEANGGYTKEMCNVPDPFSNDNLSGLTENQCAWCMVMGYDYEYGWR